jgi:hypothetical protein
MLDYTQKVNGHKEIIIGTEFQKEGFDPGSSHVGFMVD